MLTVLLSQIFPRKIEATRQLYKHLVELLEGYAKGNVVVTVKGAGE